MVQISCQLCYTDLIIEQKYHTHNQQILDMLYHTNDVHTEFSLEEYTLLSSTRICIKLTEWSLLTITLHIKLDTLIDIFYQPLLQENQGVFYAV